MARRRGGAKTVDFKQWSLVAGLITEQSTAATGIGGGLSFEIPATILRLRGMGEVMVAFDETRQVGDRIVVTYALGVIATDLFENPATDVLPDPADEPEYPWLYIGQAQLECFVADGDGALGASVYRAALPLDSKAMRKVKPRQTLCWIVQRGGLAGAPVTLISIPPVRVLVGT